MRKVVCLLIIPIFIFISAFTVFSNEVKDEGEALLVNYSGEVKIMKKLWWKISVWRDVEPNQILYADDQIKVGQDSSLEIQFHNNSRVKVMENTQIIINESQHYQKMSSSSIKVKIGEVWVDVKEGFSDIFKFKVETPNAVAGVRGTTFSVKYADDSTEVMVGEGIVEVSQKTNHEKVEVRKGYKTKVKGNEKPDKPSAAANKELGNWSKNKSKGKGLDKSNNNKNKNKDKIDKKDKANNKDKNRGKGQGKDKNKDKDHGNPGNNENKGNGNSDQHNERDTDENDDDNKSDSKIDGNEVVTSSERGE